MGLCEDCPARHTCTELCDEVRALLDSPDKGRLPRSYTPESRQAVADILDRAPLLRARDHAFLCLYHESGFTMQRIADAFGLSRSSVCRALKKGRREALRTRRQRARGERTRGS